MAKREIIKLRREGHGQYSTYLEQGCRCNYCTAAYLNTAMKKGLFPRDLRKRIPWIKQYLHLPSL